MYGSCARVLPDGYSQLGETRRRTAPELVTARSELNPGSVLAGPAGDAQ